MLEIIGIVIFSKKLAAMAKAKGRSGAWGALGAGGWISGELFGAFLGAMMGVGEIELYGVMLVCAAIGATGAYFVVRSLGSAADVPVDDGAWNHADPNNPYSPPGGGGGPGTGGV